MSLHRLSAGAGYRYLIRHTACGDAHRSAATPLTAYYTDSGYPPGRWAGTGLTGLAQGAGLSTGAAVSETAMAQLFGLGHDPVTGMPLGKAYPTYRTPHDRITTRIQALPPSLTKEQRETVTALITAEEQARPAPSAVSGFDLTFTVPKSASVLWALGDPATQTAVVEAHAAALADAVAFLEAHALFTRTGTGSIAQVTTGGAVAAAFDHWDTRTGDPNLHTHLVLANKVQGPDGLWRAIDSRALYKAAVAISEVYDDLFADQLTARLPIEWAWRDRGPRRSPAFELQGLSDRLLAAFSTRSAVITEATRAAINKFTQAHGKAPSRPDVLRLRQRVTRASRPVKTIRQLTDQLTEWQLRAQTMGETAAANRALIRQGRASAVATDVISESMISRLAGETLTRLTERRSTWTHWNVLAEAARTCRGIRSPTAADRHSLHERVSGAVLAASVKLTAPDIFTVPPAYQRANGESVFTRHHEDLHTSRTILDAERRLLDAHRDLSGPVAADAEPQDSLGEDQAAAVRAVATSQRRIDVLVGPAGSGKTRTVLALRNAWETEYGPGSVIGLAPSATAAHELAEAIGINCENTAKWLHESTKPGLADGWGLRSGQLLIVDEASLAGTLALDQLASQADAADAKILLLGDHHQLSSVEASGAFGLLATQGQPVELTSLWRFRHRWEAQATRQLRAGDPDCLDAYAAHGRLHDGPWETMLDAAYTASRQSELEGRTSLLVAADRATVEALNARARNDLVVQGRVAPSGIPVRDGSIVGVGDRIVTRRNARHLRATGRNGEQDFVRNGKLWTVTAVHGDGSLNANPMTATPADGQGTRLPSEYVFENVELGYATTLYRAEGINVDSGYTIASAATSREALYVGATRGRFENHVYLATDTADLESDGVPEATREARQLFEEILARPTSELSAIQTLQRSQLEASAAQRVIAVGTSVTGDANTAFWIKALPKIGFDPIQVTAIAESTTRGPLFAALQSGHAAGHDMSGVLAELAKWHQAEQGDAAEQLLQWIQQWLRAHETEEQALTPESRRDFELNHQSVNAGDEDVRRLLKELVNLSGRRLTRLDLSGDRPSWLQPSRVAPSQARTRATTAEPLVADAGRSPQP